MGTPPHEPGHPFSDHGIAIACMDYRKGLWNGTKIDWTWIQDRKGTWHEGMAHVPAPALRRASGMNTCPEQGTSGKRQPHDSFWRARVISPARNAGGTVAKQPVTVIHANVIPASTRQPHAPASPICCAEAHARRRAVITSLRLSPLRVQALTIGLRSGGSNEKTAIST